MLEKSVYITTTHGRFDNVDVSKHWLKHLQQFDLSKLKKVDYELKPNNQDLEV